jgi:hypothetical protein
VIPRSLHQILTLYSWFPFAGLIVFLLLIARFYQKFSGERTHFRWFVLPAVLFGAAVVRYSSINQVTGDWFGDLSMAVGGIILIVLSVRLVIGMTAGRTGQPS